MSELKVGFLVILTMAAIVSSSLLVTSRQSGLARHVPYRTVVEDASGIFPKTPVKIAGVTAGRIKKILLKGNNAEVVFEILRKIKVPKDSVLEIKSVGLLGDKYLEVRIGKSSEMLEKMGEMPSEEGAGLANLVKHASEAIGDIRKVTRELQEVLAPDGAESPISRIASDLIESVEDIRATSDKVKRLVDRNEKKLDSLIGNAESFAAELAAQVDVGNEESAVASLDRFLNNIESLSQDLRNVVEDLRAGKGTAGQLLVEEEIADEVKETLAGVKKLVGRVDKMRAEFSLYTGSNSDYGAETDAKLSLYPSPERFYWLGVTSSEFGPVEEEHTTIETNGSKDNRINRSKTKGELLVSVQLGRRIQGWSFRGGLIESSGGIGVDYSIPHWGSSFSLDVFDYRDGVGLNVRPSYTQKLWNVFYGKVTVDDAAVGGNNTSYTISGGLSFGDEDLKALLGFFL